MGKRAGEPTRVRTGLIPFVDSYPTATTTHSARSGFPDWTRLAAVGRKPAFGWTCLCLVVVTTGILVLLGSVPGEPYSRECPEGGPASVSLDAGGTLPRTREAESVAVPRPRVHAHHWCLCWISGHATGCPPTQHFDLGRHRMLDRSDRVRNSGSAPVLPRRLLVRPVRSHVGLAVTPIHTSKVLQSRFTIRSFTLRPMVSVLSTALSSP